MQDELISRFDNPHFQFKLRVVLHAAGDDVIAQMRARHKLCVPIQLPVVRRFGFDDVAQSIFAFTDELNADPEIAEKKSRLATLVNPSLRDEMKDVVNPWKQVILQHQPGRRWRVVGGVRMGGIVPRKGKEMTSPILCTRYRPSLLATGAEVEEIDLLGERLHYKKITGEGPEFGWVSIWSTGFKTLLEPLEVHAPVQMLSG